MPASVAFVGTCRCQLLLDGEVVQSLDLEGEMLPEKRQATGQRGFATFDAVLIGVDDLRTRDCQLRCD